MTKSSKQSYAPRETIADDLKLVLDTHKNQEITGYFLLTTLKTGENESKSSLYLHNAENYITLLGFLEILVLEIKTKLLLAMLDTDDDVAQTGQNHPIKSGNSPSSTKLQ